MKDGHENENEEDGGGTGYILYLISYILYLMCYIFIAYILSYVSHHCESNAPIFSLIGALFGEIQTFYILYHL